VPTIPGSYNKKIRNIRNKMIALGLNETLSYILINDKEVKKFTNDEFEEVKLLAPMTEDRNTLRYTLITSLLKIYEYNIAHGNRNISIFELGKGFFKKNGEYGEELKLCILMAGEFYTGINAKRNVDFYIIKGIIEEVLNSMEYENRYSFVVPKNPIKELHQGQSAEIILNRKKYRNYWKITPRSNKR
jgi:phenylalanyl-tRNA synthetase beta chain